MYKELVILGAGESGTGAALLAKAIGFPVFVSDCCAVKPEYRSELDRAGIEFEEGGHSIDRILNAQEVIKSPGIPDHAPLIKKLVKNNVSVISEIEFAGRYSRAKMIGVTGSNGKTTTAKWIYDMLLHSGADVKLGGNVGTSFARQLIDGDAGVFVLELSSFQLEGMIDFKCDVAIITNITPDHLDRYDYRFENYVDAKFRILNNQDANSVFIYNAHDKLINSRLNSLKYPGFRCPFAFDDVYGDGAFLEDDKNVIVITPTHHFSISKQEIGLKGKHNLSNAMTASLAALSAGASIEAVRESLKYFSGVEHRLESVEEIKGVLYINDSKATNTDSVWFALESMERPVVWIAGGTDKGNDYRSLEQLAVEKVKALVCLGVDNVKLMSFFKGKIPEVVEAKSMTEAVKMADGFSRTGDAVLLSPACASFDLFENYEQRGRMFKEEVLKLK